MATKRFTDTEKWKDPFFDELTNDYKLVWLYLLDDCDNAGIFSVNLRRLNFSCNVQLTKEDILNMFGKRLHIISEDKWLIPSFMLFQYGTNWETSQSKAVVSARKKLEDQGLTLNDNRVLLESKSSIDSVYIDYHKTIDSIKDKDKEEDKKKEQSKEQEQKKEKPKEKEKNEFRVKVDMDYFNESIGSL